MLKRANLNTRGRVLVLVGLVTAYATQAAFAGAPAPTAHIVDGSASCSVSTDCDGWLNGTESAAGLTVTGTYDTTLATPIDHIKVTVVNSPTCDLGAAQVAKPGAPPSASAAGPIVISKVPSALGVINANGTWTAGPFDATAFSDGAAVCARARASDDAGVSYTELATTESQKLIKDTLAATGTVALLDPNGDGWLNKAEFGSISPAVPSTVREQWTASPVLNALGQPDDAHANVWYTNDTLGTIPTACAKAPTTVTGAPNGDQPARQSCIDALAQWTKFTFHAQWADAAGNLSNAASSNQLRKDTEVPLAPTVALSVPKVTGANVSAITISGHVPDAVATGVEQGIRVDISVTDGVNTKSGFATTDASGNYTLTMSLAPLQDCPTSNCIVARAFATDLAGNVGPVGSSAGVPKDTLPPAIPTVVIDPQSITVINQSFVEVTVCGETGTSVALFIDDDSAPDTLPIHAAPFNLTSCRTIQMDVTGLHDGILTASATLTDSFGNTGLPGTATANKNADTSPAVKITSPAANSLTGKTVKIEGEAIPGAHITVWDSYIDPKGAPHGRVQLNGNQVTTDANAKWSITPTFGGSGTHTIEAVTDNAGGGHAANVARVVFDVDAVNPTVAVDGIGSNGIAPITLPGEPLIISGTADDDFSGVYGVQIQIFDIKNQDSLQVCITCTPPTVGLIQGRSTVDTATTCPLCAPKVLHARWSFDASGLAAGWYTATIYAVDFRNNHSTQPQKVQFLKL
jgi:hypothetical protein